MNAVLTNTASVETNALSVKGSSEFSREVTMMSSLTVFGQVIGSGPYVDSSDRRYKKNIVALEGKEALNMVEKMQAVSLISETLDVQLLQYLCDIGSL
jgi:uncharacterized Tic20 family protein